MNSPLVQTLLKFAIRRGLTILGGSAAALTDDQVSQAVAVLVVIGNEAWQAYQAHKMEKAKADFVKRPA